MKISLRSLVAIIFALWGLAAGLLGCATTIEGLPLPKATTGKITLEGGPDTAALRNGRATLVTGCTSCHRLYLPEEYKPADWAKIIKKMGRRNSLTAQQMEELELYILHVIDIKPPVKTIK